MLYPAVLTIVLVGIILGVGIYVLSAVSEGVATETITVENETVTGLAAAGDDLATADDCAARDFAALYVTNATGGETVPTTNYTLTAATGNLVGEATSAYNGKNVNISYTYTGTSDTTTCDSIITTSTGVGGFADWIAVIVVVLAAGLVLGIVVNSFGKANAA